MRTASSFRALTGREPARGAAVVFDAGEREHPKVDKVRRAVELLARDGPDFAFDGELQLDAAIVPEIARSKAPASPTAGRANTLIFPDLDAGNIGYKLASAPRGGDGGRPDPAGALPPGERPLPRACTADDIVLVRRGHRIAGHGLVSMRGVDYPRF